MDGLPRLLLPLGLLTLFMILIGFCLPGVSAESSGDAPPDSGDWNINNATALWDETRVINGSVNVNDGSLTLTNVTLYVNGHLRVEAPTDIFRSNVIITRSKFGDDPWAGGVEAMYTLVLDNTTLKLNLTANPSQDDEQQRVIVRGSGTLLVRNNSLISDGDNEEDDDTIPPQQQDSTNYRLRFIVQNGARFEVYDSIISEVGWANPAGGGNPDQTRAGITVETSDVILRNATITKCWYGLFLRTGTTNTHIDNSTFFDLESNGVVSYGTDGLIENTTFRDLNIAYFAYYQSVRWTFQYNSITSCSNGIQLNFADTHLIRYNQFTSISQRVIDLRGDAINNLIDSNTIDTAAYAVWSEGVRQSWNPRTYRYNPHHITFSNNHLTSVATGIHFNAGSTSDRQRSGGHNITFSGNTFDGGTTGIVILQGGDRRLIDDFTITGNNISGMSDICIQLTQLYDSLVNYNIIRNCSMGMKIMDSQGLNISNNRIHDSAFTGLYLSDNTKNNIIGNNTLEGFQGQGFYLKNCGPNDIRDNLVANFTGAGIWGEDQVSGSISNNTIRNGAEGFHLVGSAPTIDGNTLSDLDWAYYLLDITLPSRNDDLSTLAMGQLWQEYTMTVTVEDEDNNPKRNIDVEVYDAFGILVASDSTGSDGTTRPFNLTQYQLDPQGGRTDFTAHNTYAYYGTGWAYEAHTADAPDGRITLQIDLISPASWVIPQGDYANTSQVQVSWQVLGGHTDVVFFQLECRSKGPGEDYSNWTAYGNFTDLFTTFDVQEGYTYELRTRAVDDFGNVEDGSNEWEFEVDMTGPSTTLTSLDVEDQQKTPLDSILLEWGPEPSVTDIDSYTLLHRWRSVPYGAFGEWYPYQNIKDAHNRTANFNGPGGFEYQLKVMATDKAGNREVKEQPDLTFTIDTEAPTAWLMPLPAIIDDSELELGVGFDGDSDLQFVTLQYLLYTEERYNQGNGPTGTWLNLGVYNRTVLEEQNKIIINELESESLYLFRLIAEDDVGNEAVRDNIREYHIGDGSIDQVFQLSCLPKPSGSLHNNDNVIIQADEGGAYGIKLREGKLPLDSPDKYHLNESSGQIHFGNGVKGFQPAAGQSIRVTYEGFDDIVLVDYTPPTKPDELKLVKNSNTSVTLTWHAPDSPDVVSYKLEFSYNVEWNSMSMVTLEPTRGYISTTLTNLSRVVHNFRVIAIDRVGLPSNPSGEVRIDLRPEVEEPVKESQEEGVPPYVIGLILLMVLVVVIAGGYYLYSGREPTHRPHRHQVGGSRLEPVAPATPEVSVAVAPAETSMEPKVVPGTEFSRPTHRPGTSRSTPEPIPVPAPKPMEHPVEPTEPVGGPETEDEVSLPEPARIPTIAPESRLKIEPSPELPSTIPKTEPVPELPSTIVAFELIDGNLICQACGSIVEPGFGEEERTCLSCGNMGSSPE